MSHDNLFSSIMPAQRGSGVKKFSRWKVRERAFGNDFVSSSPSLSQLDSCFGEQGTLQYKRLRRSPVIALFRWNSFSDQPNESDPVPKERRDPMKLAHHYQALLDSGKFENRTATI